MTEPRILAGLATTRPACRYGRHPTPRPIPAPDHVPRLGSAVDAMTKAAVGGLTRGLARELGPRGITVNVIQPGPTATDTNPDSGEFADAIRELTVVGHDGRPEDIASAVAYLASPEAAFITGISWNVDGGFAA